MWQSFEPLKVFEGVNVNLYLLDYEAHVKGLYEAASMENNGEDLFAYMSSSGPFKTYAEFDRFIKMRSESKKTFTYAVYSKRLGKLVGAFTLTDIKPQHGSIEIGTVWYAKEAQKTEINTEAMYIILTYLFETIEYRRVQWECNNQNENSKRAALRLGFTLEGIFRQHYWSKGQNRDTAWLSIIDKEWVQVKAHFIEKLLNRPLPQTTR